tara:strand:- start:125 stop:307 length:183 start_codon:yes stop_codon:yes gene_type:complete
MTLYHPAKEAELKYLRRMVDVLEPEAYKTDATQDAKNKLYHARLELKQYVNKLRQEGYRI